MQTINSLQYLLNEFPFEALEKLNEILNKLSLRHNFRFMFAIFVSLNAVYSKINCDLSLKAGLH